MAVNRVLRIQEWIFADFMAAERHTLAKALGKRDARNAQALRLAHVSARGVGADRLTPDSGGRKLHPRDFARPPGRAQKRPFMVSPPEFFV
jgi:hypothetical protein